MTGFEWAADYEALCSPYGFSVSMGAHGKELKATVPAVQGQILLTESPLVAWPVRASAGLHEFNCCENCLKIRPFHQEQQCREQKLLICSGATPHKAAPTSAGQVAASASGCSRDSAAEEKQLEPTGEERSGVCVHTQNGSALWFCSTRCQQQALGVTLTDAEALDVVRGTHAISSVRKRDTQGNIKDAIINSTQGNERDTTGTSPDCSEGRRVFGWQEFLSPDALRTLRLHDQQHKNLCRGVEFQEDEASPIGVEALGRVVARVAATAASLHGMGGSKLEDAYAEACRPFLRFAAAEAGEAHAAFDIPSASAQLNALLGPTISAVLGADVAASLLGCDALAFFFGILMRNAQSLLIWGATHEGTVMVLRAAGLYVLQACCNHSCSPNCSVENGEDTCISLKAERAINPGEELTITYIPLGLPQSRRQELLNSYRFVCSCSRCVEEKQSHS